MHTGRGGHAADPSSSSIDAFGMDIHCSQLDTPKRTSVTAKRYHHFELVYVEDGVVNNLTGSRCAGSPSYDVFFMPPDSPRCQVDPSQQATWSLRFSLETVDGHLRLLLEPLLDTTHSYTLPETDRSRWEERFRYLRHELRVQRFCDSGAVRAVFRSVLLDLIGLAHVAPPQEVRGRSLLDSVFTFIEDHYRHPIGLRDVAREVHLSPAYLTDLVRRKTGKPVHQWITDRRIHEARILLVETDRSVASIADKVGFNDPSYFCRQFVKIVGKSPGASRTADRLSEKREFDDPVVPWREKPPIDQWLSEAQKIRELADELGDLTQTDQVARRAMSTAFETLKPTVSQYIERCAGDGLWRPQFEICTRRRPELPIASDADGVLPFILTGQTIAAHNLTDSPNDWLRSIAKLGFRCSMVTPIRIGRECVGGIRVLKKDEPAFSVRERVTLAMIGDLTGLALRGVTRSPISQVPARTSLRTQSSALGIAN